MFLIFLSEILEGKTAPIHDTLPATEKQIGYLKSLLLKVANTGASSRGAAAYDAGSDDDDDAPGGHSGGEDGVDVAGALERQRASELLQKLQEGRVMKMEASKLIGEYLPLVREL